MDWHFAVDAAYVLVLEHVEAFIGSIHNHIEVGGNPQYFAEGLAGEPSIRNGQLVNNRHNPCHDM